MNPVQPIAQARYSIGELIHHRLFGYRGVIVDIDQDFQGSDEWYQSVARSRPPRDKPWYHVLVHDSEHSTYVAERNLEPDTLLKPIKHPLLGRFFRGFEGQSYLRINQSN